MHDGMPPIQGQGEGHECLKATREELTVSHARDLFYYLKLLTASREMICSTYSTSVTLY